MKTYPIKDIRLTIEVENYEGLGPRHVLRFNGKFIAQSISYSSMVIRAAGKLAQLQGAKPIEEVLK